MKMKQYRVNANLRQEDIAVAMKIDRTTVTKWESGDSLPRADKLPQLAKILGCTVDELLADDAS